MVLMGRMSLPAFMAFRELSQKETHARDRHRPLFLRMKLRKRDKIVVLFWVPFWTLAAAFVAGIGWAVGVVRLH